MHPLTAAELRAGLVNCSRRDVARLPVPPDLGALDWDRLPGSCGGGRRTTAVRTAPPGAGSPATVGEWEPCAQW